MDTLTTASAAAAPVAPAIQPTVAPSTESQSTPVVANTPASPSTLKTANDLVLASGEDIAARYGITETPAVEPAPEAVAPVVEAAPVVETPAPVTPPADVITQPITPFQFYDEQGELEIPANVKIGFKAGGKEYKDLRLDEVVRMAQQAPMAEKHRAEAEQYRPLAEQAQQAVQAYQQAFQELQQNNALYEQLLSNDNLYIEAATKYRETNTPEHRLARLQEQQQAERTQYQQQIQQTQLQQTIAAAANYTATRIAPSIESLAQQHPDLDVMAKFHELTAPLLSASPNGGVWVAPNRLGEVESSVLPQLDAWTKAKAAKSTAASQAASATATAQLQKAQLDAQVAKRQLARPLTPVGNAPMSDAPKPKPIKTSGDAIEATLARARQQINTGGA